MIGFENTRYVVAVQIPRKLLENQIAGLLRRHPVVCMLGARQVGKTTLARRIVKKQRARATLYDLENPDDLARLSEPLAALRRHQGLIVIDEVQRAPNLFSVLRVLADERPTKRRFLILGSASPALLRQSAESLAGRIVFIEIPPLRMSELPSSRWLPSWLRGGFPRALLAATDSMSLEWRRAFRQTFLERDIPQLEAPGTPSASTLGRYWAMLAHVHAEVLNWSELGRSMGVSDATARRYADLLEGTLMVRQLKPWHENISKRQVKSPKLYFRDSGLLHVLLGVRSLLELEQHPRCGASWEGFLIEQILDAARVVPDEPYFWRTEHGAELDLLLVRGTSRIGFEIKRAHAPTLTPSMRTARDDLKLDALYVVHSGTDRYPLSDRVEAVPWVETVRLAQSVQ